MGDDEALSQFEGHLLTEQRVAQNTFLAYKRDLRQFARFVRSKKVSLCSVRATHLKSFLRNLHSKRLSPSSVARKISALKAFYGYLSERMGVRNCTESLRAPKMEKKLPRYLSESEIRIVFETIDDARDPKSVRNKIMFHLLYVSGMRISELISLRLANVQSEGALISVLGKGGKERLIPIPMIIAKKLCTYITESPSLHTKQNKERYLFPVTYKSKVKHISRQSFWMILRDMCKKAGIQRAISPHQLRHSFATHMLTHGADLRSLQLLLGHENLTTVQIYTHVDTSHLRVIYDKKHPRS